MGSQPLVVQVRPHLSAEPPVRGPSRAKNEASTMRPRTEYFPKHSFSRANRKPISTPCSVPCTKIVNLKELWKRSWSTSSPFSGGAFVEGEPRKVRKFAQQRSLSNRSQP